MEAFQFLWREGDGVRPVRFLSIPPVATLRIGEYLIEPNYVTALLSVRLGVLTLLRIRRLRCVSLMGFIIIRLVRIGFFVLIAHKTILTSSTFLS
ncbi:hypothetical protein DAD99_20775 [Pseudarthrobacter sp. AB1]|nr:hypothetical protein [Pseudarthrobacter sp. AB1]